MISFLTSFVSTSGTARTKDRYTLDQILTIMLLKDRKVKAEAIAAAVGHPKNSITYKCMWIAKQVAKHGDNVLVELFKEFNVALPEGDIVEAVTARVEAFLTPVEAEEEQELSVDDEQEDAAS
jgi:hypothetical protein